MRNGNFDHVKRNEKVLVEELKGNVGTNQLLNIQTAYLGNYERHYFQFIILQNVYALLVTWRNK
jgi:hypothetical protein